jgi:TPR repeat protein
MLQFLRAFSLLSLCLPQSSQADIPPAAQAKLEAACKQGKAESCATLGAAVYEKDKEKGAEWFRKACDLGKESSCVFYDSAHPRPAPRVVAAPVATVSAPATQLSPIMAWATANIPPLLLALFPVKAGSDPDHFSLDHCRIPDVRLMELIMKMRPSYPHAMHFDVGCDAEGTLLVQLNTVSPLDLRVRKIQNISRIVGRALMVVERDPKRSGYVQTTNISDAIAYDEKGGVFARFEITHHRYLEMNLAAFYVTTTESIGKVAITEFQGKPVQFAKVFDLEHVDQ